MAGRPVSKDDVVRRRIIAAAEELFADKGFAASSISDISNAAEVNRALIYYYFTDKQELYNTILQEGQDRILKLAQTAYSAQGKATERLGIFIRGMAQMQLQRCNFGRIILRGLVDNREEMTNLLDQNFKRVAEITEKIVEEGVESGELRDLNPELIVHMIQGLSHSLFMLQTRSSKPVDFDKCVEQMLDVLANGIVRN